MSEQDDLANSMDQTEEQPADLGQLASQLFSESELQAGLAALTIRMAWPAWRDLPNELPAPATW